MNQFNLTLFPHASRERIYEILHETYHDSHFPLIKEEVTQVEHSIYGRVMVLYHPTESRYPYKIAYEISQETPERHPNVHLFVSTDEHPETKRITYRIHFGDYILHENITSRRELYKNLKSFTGKSTGQVSMALDNRHNI